MKKALFTLILPLLLTTSSLYARMVVNTDGTMSEPSVMPDVKSDWAGILIPRMTTAQRDAINNPAEGLLVFVTDNSTFYYFNDSNWIECSTGKNRWKTSGNSVYVITSNIGKGLSFPAAKSHRPIIKRS